LEEKNETNARLREMDQILLDSKLVSTEASSDAKDIKSRFEEIRNKQEDLIRKNEELRDEKRKLEAEIRKFDEVMIELRNFKEKNIAKITYYNKLAPLMEQEAQFKAFLIIEKVGSISLEDLRNAMGSPIVLVKKLVQNLQEVDLLDIDDIGKIHVKKIEQ
jgi:predicted nuclease with TOPRIM domain